MPQSRKREEQRIQVDLSLFGVVSDMELLGIVDDLADENGWTTTLEVRLQLGENPEEQQRSGAGTRLAWMRRYGWLEGEGTGSKSNPKRWRLTAIGTTLLENPDLSKTMQNALGRLNPAQRLIVTRQLAEEAGGSADEVRNALRRQWNRSLRGPRYDPPR